MSLVKISKLNTHCLATNLTVCFSVNLVISPSHCQNIDFMFKVKTGIFSQATHIPKTCIHAGDTADCSSGTGTGVVWGFQPDSERLNGLIRPFIRREHGNRTVGQIH